jgi:hypothetical protein
VSIVEVGRVRDVQVSVSSLKKMTERRTLGKPKVYRWKGAVMKQLEKELLEVDMAKQGDNLRKGVLTWWHAPVIPALEKLR